MVKKIITWLLEKAGVIKNFEELEKRCEQLEERLERVEFELNSDNKQKNGPTAAELINEWLNG